MEQFWISAGKYGLGVVGMVVMAVALWRFVVGQIVPRLFEQQEAANKRFDELSERFIANSDSQRNAFLGELREERSLRERNADEQRKALSDMGRDIATRLDRIQIRP